MSVGARLVVTATSYKAAAYRKKGERVCCIEALKALEALQGPGAVGATGPILSV